MVRVPGVSPTSGRSTDSTPESHVETGDGTVTENSVSLLPRTNDPSTTKEKKKEGEETRGRASIFQVRPPVGSVRQSVGTLERHQNNEFLPRRRPDPLKGSTNSDGARGKYNTDSKEGSEELFHWSSGATLPA